MKISLQWLKSYIDLNLTPEKLAEILTEIGLEVEGFETTYPVPGGLEGVVVGEVIECGPHPNADRLSLTKVDVGTDNLLQVVCGAPNVAKGQKVLVATVGTSLYDKEGTPWKIKKGKIRGEVSEGMICAEDELHLGDDHSGIIVLDESAKVGTTAREQLGIQADTVFEIGLTPNRSDATSHLGVALDLAAALKINYGHDGIVQRPSHDDWKVDNPVMPIKVTVENEEACPRYAGVCIKGVRIGESPEWLKSRLLSIGVRPINNVVDITNFVLHEMGQPLHAFDYSQITQQEVRVKTLPSGTNFKSLDEEDRKLSADDLMICDGADQGMCIAGVFGGINSGVKESTTDIFLESAHFDALWVRRTSTRHLLYTDAARTFEKGSDPNICVTALKRAALLIKELAGGSIASDIIDIYPSPIERSVISLSYAQLNKLVGTVIPIEEVQSILTAMEMDIKSVSAEGLTVAVPTNKADVKREADLIEEVLRIYGFNKVPVSDQMSFAMQASAHPDPSTIKNRIANYLASNGFLEMMALSMVDRKYVEEVFDVEESELIRINNTSNVQIEVMRPDMMISALEAVVHNQNRQQTTLRLFEFGKTYRHAEGGYVERSVLALTLAGFSTDSWLAGSLPSEKEFFVLKSMVEGIFTQLGLQGLKTSPAESKSFANGLQYGRGKQHFASVGRVSQKLIQGMQIRGPVFYADIDWDLVLQFAKIDQVKLSEISKYPTVRRDLAMIIDKSVQFDQLRALIEKRYRKVISEINLFDVYEDEKVLGEGKKSYALSIVFQDPTRTFSDKDVDKMIDTIVKDLGSQVGAKLR